MIERSNLNNLTIEAFALNSTTRIGDLERNLIRAQNVRFSTIYPGGRFLTASLFIPREIARFWEVEGMQRFVIRNGLVVIFEGALATGFGQWRETTQGVKLNLIGYWGTVMMSRGINKPWIDTRSSPDVWVWLTDDSVYTALDWMAVCRDDGNVHIHALTGTVPNTGLAGLRRTVPTGQTIKRVTYAYDFSEGAGNDFTMRVWNVEDAGVEPNTSISAEGVGLHDIELNQGGQGSYTQSLELQLISNKANVTTHADHNHAQWNNITIYTEVDDPIDAGVIAGDVVGHLSDDINSDITKIKFPGSEILPFISQNYEIAASVLARAVGYGDASHNSWAVGLLPSDDATTPDGKPVLFMAQQPDLDDFELAIRVDESNMVPPFSVEEDWFAIRNWIIVEYADENGWRQTITPDIGEFVNLKDDDSIAEWGRRERKLRISSATAADAFNFGARYLAKHKEIQWTMNMPIKVKGYIRNKDGGITPTSEVYAGQRIKIENFLSDLSGTGLTLSVTGTGYDDESEIVSLQTGRPDVLNLLPTFVPPRVPEALPPEIDNTVEFEGDIPFVDGPGQQGFTDEGGSRRPANIWRFLGITRAQWQGMSVVARRALAASFGYDWWSGQ